MVRLKGTSPSAKCASCTISIPHGTIKSQGGPAQVHAHDHISIPHGTIKRHSRTARRLRTWISIPHGTIKRQYKGQRQPGDYISIPHGTIKSILLGIADSRLLYYFNSTWFD